MHSHFLASLFQNFSGAFSNAPIDASRNHVTKRLRPFERLYAIMLAEFPAKLHVAIFYLGIAEDPCKRWLWYMIWGYREVCWLGCKIGSIGCCMDTPFLTLKASTRESAA